MFPLVKRDGAPITRSAFPTRATETPPPWKYNSGNTVHAGDCDSDGAARSICDYGVFANTSGHDEKSLRTWCEKLSGLRARSVQANGEGVSRSA